METARLILDYLKILIWPLVLVVLLLTFHAQIKDRLANAPIKVSGLGGSIDVGTGHENTAGLPGNSRPPDVWWSIKETKLSSTECIDHAKTALDTKGFQRVSGGGVTYGYTDQFVGAFWCGYRDNAVFIVVAGPQKDLVARHDELAKAFFSASR